LRCQEARAAGGAQAHMLQLGLAGLPETLCSPFTGLFTAK